MADKKRNISPKDCDRWDTIPGVTKTIYNTPEALEFARKYNEELKKKAAGKKKK